MCQNYCTIRACSLWLGVKSLVLFIDDAMFFIPLFSFLILIFLFLLLRIPYKGHAKRVLCSEFHPNGFQLTTAGDDGTIRVWDMRKRSSVAVIPAHSNLITQLRFYPSSDESSSNGDILATSSFDGSCRLWSTRDWTMLHTLQGHEGKVTGVDFITYPTTSSAIKTPFSVASCGFDKTLKLWT
jgi:U4/U6 small nuclear ribonucleoprotein PRP4